MAEYINRGTEIAKLTALEVTEPNATMTSAKRLLADMPAADVAPVVRCKDCIYTRKLYGRLVCKYGTCSGCILREDFFCANGKRKEGAENENPHP